MYAAYTEQNGEQVLATFTNECQEMMRRQEDVSVLMVGISIASMGGTVGYEVESVVVSADGNIGTVTAKTGRRREDETGVTASQGTEVTFWNWSLDGEWRRNDCDFYLSVFDALSRIGESEWEQ
jgi:hypothetical protein